MAIVEAYPPGIPDEMFIRGQAPMTKAEIRAVAVAKLRLRSGMRVLDIGAGTGSVTVEIALLCGGGEVFAIERDLEAVELIHRNLERFGVGNVTVLGAEAPAALSGLGKFERIFIGGSGGQLGMLLASLPPLLLPGGRAVSNTVCLESTAEVLEAWRRPPWIDCEVTQISAARGVAAGRLTRFEAVNPVFIAAAGIPG